MNNISAGNISTAQARSRSGPGWQRLALAAGVVLLFALALWMIGSQITGDLAQQRQAQAITVFEEETGIRILRVAMTSGGGMVDMQFQVMDPDKSLIIHDDDNPPTLIEEKSKIIVATPFHEHKARELHTAVTYHVIIMNGSGLLERGSKVTLRVGDALLEHLIVQ